MSFVIGVENIKNNINIAALMRSAYCYGASMFFTIGHRYRPTCADTTKGFRHIPVLNFKSWDEYKQHSVYRWMHIGVELADGAENLCTFVHPKSAVYLLGPEDGSLSKIAQDICKYIVYIPTTHCLNVATCGATVMYDRIAKEHQDAGSMERHNETRQAGRKGPSALSGLQKPANLHVQR